MPQIRVDVHSAGGDYPILIGDGLADRASQQLDEWRVGPRRFVVSNPVVWRFHGERMAAALPGADVILIPDGERHKHVASVGRIYDALVRAGADRGSVIVAVGGGVIGDMAGFAAATFLRGIGLVQVPTTLLAQVDASVGGKVGVNLAGGQESRRRLLPAAPRCDRSLVPANAAAPRVPRRPVRGDQIRHRLQRRPVRAARSRGWAPDRSDIPGRRDAHRRLLPHQGRNRVGGRARSGRAPRAQLRPHRRARDRGAHRLPQVPPRRGRGVGHAGRRPGRRRGAA